MGAGSAATTNRAAAGVAAMPSGLRLEGVAYLPKPGEVWIVPDGDVSLDLGMNPRWLIGRAKLTGHPDGSMTCIAKIPAGLVDDDLLLVLKNLPVFALTGARFDGPAHLAMRVSVVGFNVNALVPPYRLESVDA